MFYLLHCGNGYNNIHACIVYVQHELVHRRNYVRENVFPADVIKSNYISSLNHNTSIGGMIFEIIFFPSCSLIPTNSYGPSSHALHKKSTDRWLYKRYDFNTHHTIQWHEWSTSILLDSCYNKIYFHRDLCVFFCVWFQVLSEETQCCIQYFLVCHFNVWYGSHTG